MAIHAAMVDRMDKEIGRIIEQLKAMKAFDNTIIFFASDNGASAEMMIRDGGHDLIGNLLVDCLQARLGAGLGFLAQGLAVQRFAILHHHAARARQFHIPAPGCERAEDPHGHDGGVGLDDGEADAAARGLELAIGGSRALREKDDGAARMEAVENAFQASRARAIASWSARIEVNPVPAMNEIETKP